MGDGQQPNKEVLALSVAVRIIPGLYPHAINSDEISAPVLAIRIVIPTKSSYLISELEINIEYSCPQKALFVRN